jgi:hypothetical protein
MQRIAVQTNRICDPHDAAGVQLAGTKPMIEPAIKVWFHLSVATTVVGAYGGRIRFATGCAWPVTSGVRSWRCLSTEPNQTPGY